MVVGVWADEKHTRSDVVGILHKTRRIINIPVPICVGIVNLRYRIRNLVEAIYVNYRW